MLPIVLPAPFKSNCSLGNGSSCTLEVNELITISPALAPVVGCVIATPEPPTISLNVNAFPPALTTGIFPPSPTSELGVSARSVNAICPPRPKTAYNSWKFSLVFLNDSRILSPVPSLPSTPISTIFLDIDLLQNDFVQIFSQDFYNLNVNTECSYV